MILPEHDIHNHLLPGVDDGFRHSSSSLKAIERMMSAGCRRFTFTPHMNPDVYRDVDESRHREVYESFSQSIPAEWNVKTELAAEYMVVNEFEDRVSSRADELLKFSDGSILIEMSYYFRSPNLEPAIFELNMAGLKPILAHPERYIYMASSLSDFDRIAEMGCRFQMNLMSVTGKYGPDSLLILNYLAKRGLYSFTATDLHSIPQLESILAYKPGFFQRRRLEKLNIF